MIANDFGNLLLHVFNSGKQFKSHEELQKKLRQYYGIDIVLFSENFGNQATRLRGADDNDHASPHHQPYVKIEEGLVLSSAYVCSTSEDHYECQNHVYELIEGKFI